jgi:iron complex transport system substrate-binding protein
MADQTDETRRRFITSRLGVAAGLSLAGCTGSTDEETTTTTAGGTTRQTTEAVTTTEGETTEDETTEAAAEGESYSAEIQPVGEVTFESVPETWVANNGSWADMGIALGREPPEAVWLTPRYHTQYYDEIPGVSVDASGMVDLYSDGVSKELFYELDADVHVIDPNFLTNRFKGWDRGDVDEIAENVGPFFANSIFSTGYQWHEDYEYPSLYEAFEKLARVFQRTDRYEAFAALHDEFQSSLSNVVPPESERPSVAILWPQPADEPEAFSPYLIGEGTSFKQWRDLGVTDALAETDIQDFHSTRGEIDYETLFEIDPDVLLLRGHEAKTAEEFRNTVLAYMKNHDLASTLTAVQNDDVYRGGPLYQGPITNLVVTERAARQVYPEVVGDRQLFDRQRVADVVNGDL